MRTPVLYTALFLLALPVMASAQTVHPAGAALTALNWQPASNTDSLRVDVDGDNVADIIFRENNYLPTGAGQPTRYFFTAAPLSPGAELALDSVEFDSAHRFLANDEIGRGLRWSTTGAYLAYTLLGNGGIGGRGFFRNGATGYVVLRKRVANSLNYWWFNVSGRTNGTVSQVYFYGQSAGRTLSFPNPGVAQAAIQVFPNPASNGWHLTGNGSFRLYDSQSRLLQHGLVNASATVSTAALAPGMYLLQFRTATGVVSNQKLIRE
ncbi:T9SS type A sorting domain-containing protein [Microvirga sp. STR05]|uniref:T9SS type A sorting domain-containing protein n=1 Tax=Hymenobacter duratus TaxID=2771356 RepID=A0ABR8JFA3_9BACT|nr:T9SS type A sorting domain-containing protein [Hymenobacter duratus]MBD2714470.1 T9SS type A sorting domain-containing protein [Hymenobacter duratus]MBR7949374.1 T9SS type A sorting domain-containing protein [Microvirga sp. STR05]